jgi:hypothetical protein
MQMTRADDFVGAELFERATIASTEPCTSPLITSGNSLRPAGLELAHHLLERAARRRAARLLALLRLAIIR